MAELGRRYSRVTHRDARGELIEFLTGQEEAQAPWVKRVYVVEAPPGMLRGGHYHLRSREYFAVLRGHARFFLEHPKTGVREQVELRSSVPETLEVPEGIAHAVLALGAEPLLLLAMADTPHDEADVVRFPMTLSLGQEDAGG